MPLTRLVMVKVTLVENGDIMDLRAKYGANLCISQGLKLRERQASLTEVTHSRKKETKKGENF